MFKQLYESEIQVPFIIDDFDNLLDPSSFLSEVISFDSIADYIRVRNKIDLIKNCLSYQIVILIRDDLGKQYFKDAYRWFMHEEISAASVLKKLVGFDFSHINSILLKYILLNIEEEKIIEEKIKYEMIKKNDPNDFLKLLIVKTSTPISEKISGSFHTVINLLSTFSTDDDFEYLKAILLYLLSKNPILVEIISFCKNFEEIENLLHLSIFYASVGKLCVDWEVFGDNLFKITRYNLSFRKWNISHYWDQIHKLGEHAISILDKNVLKNQILKIEEQITENSMTKELFYALINDLVNHKRIDNFSVDEKLRILVLLINIDHGLFYGLLNFSLEKFYAFLPKTSVDELFKSYKNIKDYENALKDHLFIVEKEKDLKFIQTLKKLLTQFDVVNRRKILFKDPNDWGVFYKNDYIPLKIYLADLESQYARIQGQRSIISLRNKFNKIEKSLQREFFKVVKRDYPTWITAKRVNLTSNLISKFVQPKMIKHPEKKIIILVFDGLPLDYWIMLRPYFEELFNIIVDDFAFCLLPSTTKFSRAALFAGKLPIEISGRNQDVDLFNLLGLDVSSASSCFLTEADQEKNRKTVDTLIESNNRVTTLIFNFFDNLAHLSKNFSNRSVVTSYFEEFIYPILLKISKQRKALVYIFSDHGFKCLTREFNVSDLKTSGLPRIIPLRYIQFESHPSSRLFIPDWAHLIVNPSTWGLKNRFPVLITSGEIALRSDKRRKSSLGKIIDKSGHGGITLDEVLVPVVLCEPQKFHKKAIASTPKGKDRKVGKNLPSKVIHTKKSEINVNRRTDQILNELIREV